MVVVVRKDLRLGPGKLAVQVAHAAVSLSELNNRRGRPEYKAWLREGQKKVVVKAENERHLFEIREAAERMGFPTVVVQDAGLTQVEPGTVTCVGIGPDRDSEMDKLTGDLPLG
ncbi:MAG TPA: peptidyl-tRNA hydrolase Pth2 [Candidatus Thermoplasmatota archaeon]|nr:peptidyl-tRNA hydrolase Pth2 [Candidatus Thermoplasmatota archaeon]